MRTRLLPAINPVLSDTYRSRHSTRRVATRPTAPPVRAGALAVLTRGVSVANKILAEVEKALETAPREQSLALPDVIVTTTACLAVAVIAKRARGGSSAHATAPSWQLPVTAWVDEGEARCVLGPRRRCWDGRGRG
jgi:hypothetical protein